MDYSSQASDSQGSLSWYLRRLQSMPLAEIPHRVKETWLKHVGRSAIISRRDERLAASLLNRDLPTLPFMFDGLKGALSDSAERALKKDVDNLCQGRLKLLGQAWPAGAICDWSLDPQSLEHWTWQKYTFDIPRKNGQGPGDVKLVWELSRLQHLQVLALGALVLRREDARDRCLEQLETWFADNPAYLGLGYACGIELASRVISMLVIVTCLGADTLGEPIKTKIWQALAVHGRWIARFPSLYSSANNHLVAESAALYILGAVCPEFPDAGSWQSVGWARLENEARRQVLPDGTGAEQSPTYLAYTMEWLLLARTVCVSVSSRTTTEIDGALERGARFIASIADRKGNIPFVGDNDEGVVLRPGLTEDHYPASVVTATANCLQCGDALHPSFKPDLRTLMLTDNALPASTFTFASKVFRDGGYTVIRSHEAAKEIFLMFDHGPLGFAETAAHGHADALAVWLHLDGEPILTDFGTYRYNADAGWRSWARSTAAHNTIELGNHSQSVSTGPFNWGRRAQGELLYCDLDGATKVCRASHDGYAATEKVIHERQVEIEAGKLVKISDSLRGQGEHFVRLNFHFSAGIDLEALDGNRYAINRNDEFLATVNFSCPDLVHELVRQEGQMQPGPGAMSPGYNELAPSSSLLISGQVSLPYTCETTFTVAGTES